MTSPTETVTVRAAMDDDLSRPMREVREETRKTARQIDNLGASAGRGGLGLGRLEGKVLGLARSTGHTLALGLKVGALALAGLITTAGLASIKLIGLATDAAETASKYRTVFGPAVAEVDAHLKSLHDRFGIATKDLQDAASTFGIFGKAAGIPAGELAKFSTSLTDAGLDLASFYNADPGEVFLALRSGLAGEAEPLRQFGIFLSDATMKAKAATMGLSDELTESQKVMVRQAIILESLGDAQGDMARTSDGLANKLRALKGRLTEAATTIGTAMLPMATALVTSLEQRVGPATEVLATKLPAAVERAREAFDHARYIVTDFFQIWERAGAIDAVAWLDRVTGSGGQLSGAFGEVHSVVSDVAAVIRDGLVPGITDAASAIDPAWLTPLGAAREILGLLADNAGLVHAAVVVLTAALIVNRTIMLGTIAVAKAQAAILFVQTAMTYGLSYALKAGGTAAKIYTAAQWLMNAAMTANPIGLLVVAIGVLVAGLVYLYNNSETARHAMREFGAVVLDVFAVAFQVATGALYGLLWGLGKIPGFGWAKDAANAIKGVADKLRETADNLRDMNDQEAKPKVTIVGMAQAEENLIRLERRMTNIGGVQVRIPAQEVVRAGSSMRGGRTEGDTARPHAGGISRGNLGRTLAFHAAIAGPGTKITSAVRHHALGSIDSDHPRGKALDLRGGNLQGYRARARQRGAYAEFHGDGDSRHLHMAVGDTPGPRAPRASSAAGGGGLVIYGGVHVDARGAAFELDIEAAVIRALERAKADAVELEHVETGW